MRVIDRLEQEPTLRQELVLNSRNARLGLQHERQHPSDLQQSSELVAEDRVDRSLPLRQLAHFGHSFAAATHKNLNPGTAG
jgi:hypothetical protein